MAGTDNDLYKREIFGYIAVFTMHTKIFQKVSGINIGMFFTVCIRISRIHHAGVWVLLILFQKMTLKRDTYCTDAFLRYLGVFKISKQCNVINMIIGIDQS